jgi:hypothetical protein
MRKVLAVGLILICGASAAAFMFEGGRRGLIVHEADGRFIVNTHPAQPIDLNPWSQPRLTIKMWWEVEGSREVQIEIGFISMSKKMRMCPEVRIFAAGAWRDIQRVRWGGDREVKGGSWEQITATISEDELYLISQAEKPQMFDVCGNKFRIHPYEVEDFHEAVMILGELRR